MLDAKDALSIAELTDIPVEQFYSEVDEVHLMVRIMIDQVAHFLRNEKELVHLLVLADQLPVWEVLAQAEVSCEVLDVRISWINSVKLELSAVFLLLNCHWVLVDLN